MVGTVPVTSEMGRAAEDLSPESYFVEAMGVLAREGPKGVTVDLLCTRLGVTKGSFYHHFRGRPQFVEALLGYWKDEHAARLIRISEEASDPLERIAILKRIAVGLPHDAEAAIRSWSFQDETVARYQAEVDRMRTAHLRDAYAATGIPKARSQVLATIAMSVLVGMQLLLRPVPKATAEAIFSELETALIHGKGSDA